VTASLSLGLVASIFLKGTGGTILFMELPHPFFQSGISPGVARHVPTSAELAGPFDNGVLFTDHSGPIQPPGGAGRPERQPARAVGSRVNLQMEQSTGGRR
jgi:hypothetical protein